MSGLQDSVNRISRDVRECLRDNGYKCNKNNFYIYPDINQQLVATAYATKNDKIYIFKLLLSNDYIKCEDEDIEFDMRPYKNRKRE